MKDIYVIFAFHAHELLWDLPEKLLSYLDEGNPMKGTIQDLNYIKKRKEEDRDVYTLSVQLGDKLDAPICVEYSNELLHQLGDVVPEVLETLKEAYQRGRLYPVYGHAHHTHISLLKTEEVTQEIIWNMQFLHNYMDVPYPKYKGLFSAEASYIYHKLEGAERANISYVIFPHLNTDKVKFQIEGKGDYTYKPFKIKTPDRDILAIPRNFPISQEIWRPITRMKRDEVKDQGYKLGDYPVFYNEYLTNQVEGFPIDFDEGVDIYKKVLRQELEKAPPDAVLTYIQDLELMDFGDIAIEILQKAWKDILNEDSDKYSIHFVTPDDYIDRVLKEEGIHNLPELIFDSICWAPEIRLVLRADGHYPPIGVTGVGRYHTKKTGTYQHPLIFWENGKYFCGIFDTLLDTFNISTNIPVDAVKLNSTGYDLAREELDSQAVIYLRLMKRACNWGWRPTEGRQKRSCLDGVLLCRVLLQKLEEFPDDLIFHREPVDLDPRDIVGIVETLKIFIDNRVNYLRYGMEKYMAEKGEDLSAAYREMEEIYRWKKIAVQKARDLYLTGKNREIAFVSRIKQNLLLMQEYSQAVFMATEHIQKVWGVVPGVEFMVDKMYEYLYEQYPPLFPRMLDHIDTMSTGDIEAYFEAITGELEETPFRKVT